MTTRVSAEMTTGVVKTTEKASKTTLTTSAANDGLLVQLDSSGLLIPLKEKRSSGCLMVQAQETTVTS